MTDKAKRNNNKKVQLSRNPRAAALEQAKVWQYGADKYDGGKNKGHLVNWRKLWGRDTILLAVDSAQRHLSDVAEGELFDEESGLPNAAHVMCNMAMIIQYMADTNMIDPKTYDAKKPPHTEEETRDRNGSYFQGGKL